MFFESPAPSIDLTTTDSGIRFELRGTRGSGPLNQRGFSSGLAK